MYTTVNPKRLMANHASIWRPAHFFLTVLVSYWLSGKTCGQPPIVNCRCDIQSFGTIEDDWTLLLCSANVSFPNVTEYSWQVSELQNISLDGTPTYGNHWINGVETDIGSLINISTTTNISGYYSCQINISGHQCGSGCSFYFGEISYNQSLGVNLSMPQDCLLDCDPAYLDFEVSILESGDLGNIVDMDAKGGNLTCLADLPLNYTNKLNWTFIPFPECLVNKPASVNISSPSFWTNEIYNFATPSERIAASTTSPINSPMSSLPDSIATTSPPSTSLSSSPPTSGATSTALFQLITPPPFWSNQSTGNTSIPCAHYLHKSGPLNNTATLVLKEFYKRCNGFYICSMSYNSSDNSTYIKRAIVYVRHRYRESVKDMESTTSDMSSTTADDYQTDNPDTTSQDVDRNSKPFTLAGGEDKEDDDDGGDDDGLNDFTSGILGFLGCFALVALVGGVIYYRRRKKKRRLSRSQKTVSTITGSDIPLFLTKTCSKEENNELEEFPRKHIRFLDTIGKGTFGTVVKAEVLNLCKKKGPGSKHWTTVAVKMTLISQKENEELKKDFLSELNLMKTIPAHVNIITLYASCSAHDPYLMILEYAHHGDLRKFLHEHRMERNYANAAFSAYGVLPKRDQNETDGYCNLPGEQWPDGVTMEVKDILTSRDLLSYALQICRGLEHLTRHKIVHRDVAARNALLFEHNIVKISDFGLARHVGQADVYERTRKGLLPIRWMSPEALFYNQYSETSDVWSYGVLLWELITLGSTPYPGMDSATVLEKIRERDLLTCPPHASTEVNSIISSCWLEDLKTRPTFFRLGQQLEQLLEAEVEYVDLDQMNDHEYSVLDPLED